MDPEKPRTESDWLSIVDRGSWAEITDEEVVMAFQDMRRTAVTRLVEALHDEAVSRLLGHVRGHIGYYLYNDGWDAVDYAMYKLVDALLDGASSGGKALRTDSRQTARRRATDGVRKTNKTHKREIVLPDGAMPEAAVQPPTQEQDVDTATALAAVPDPRERLAYLLHLIRTPIEGEEDSICSALGVSRPTAKKLIARAQRKVAAALRSRPQSEKGP